MKVKLLKKVRKNFRIVENGLGKQYLQERKLFDWNNYCWSTEYHFIEILYKYTDALGQLRAILDYRYSKYSRKEKIKKQKEKQLTKVWYNK